MRDNRVSEVLLHFIWRFRYFNHRGLETEGGEPVTVHYPGDPNTDQGPDFKNARITVGDNLLEGPVELHLRTSDWIRHGHAGDPHYQRVILHVVWDNDTAAPPSDIPILTLCHRTPKPLLPRYQEFMTSQSFVPCERLLPANLGGPALAANLAGPASAGEIWPAFRHHLLIRRLDHRTAFIRSLIDENNPHWDETIFRLIARSLGQPVNTDGFLAIAQSFPLSFLLRRRADPARLESLFRAAAARLDPPLSFHRMRPAHSPDVRLRQLAAILTRYTGWFTTLIESDDPAILLKTLDVDGLGVRTKRSILINAHIPLLCAYSLLRQEPQQRAKAIRWLMEMPPENNTIIRSWQQLGLPAASAADTQALLELKKNFCDPKRCLDCAIGQSLLTSPAEGSPTPSPASENLS
jgi:hypothetical protein